MNGIAGAVSAYIGVLVAAIAAAAVAVVAVALAAEKGKRRWR